MKPVSRAVAAACGVLTALVLTTPGYADDESSPSPEPSGSPSPTPSTSPTPGPAADLDVEIPTRSVAEGSAGKWVRIDLENRGPDTAVRPTLRIELLKVSPDIDVEFADEGCDVDERVAVCQLADLAADDITALLGFKLTPEPGAAAGPAARVRVTASSDTPDPFGEDNTALEDFVIEGSGVDFAVYAEPVGPIKPGRTGRFSAVFANQGDQSADGFTLDLGLPNNASWVEDYQECTYSHHRSEVRCEVPVAVGPGEVIDLSGLFHVRASTRAPGPGILGRGRIFIAESTDPRIAAAGGRSLVSAIRAQRLAASKAIPGDDESFAMFTIRTGPNPVDFGITGGTVRGDVGQTLKLPFRVTRHNSVDTQVFRFTLEAPSGTEFTGRPSGGHAFECGPDVGSMPTPTKLDCVFYNSTLTGDPQHVDFTVPVKITGAEVGGSTAKVSSYYGYPDPNLKNNSVPVHIRLPGGSAGGGGGLPVTGTGLSGLVAGGVMALLLGFALVLAVRWRRTPVRIRY